MTTETTVKTSRLINTVPFFYGWIILGMGTLGTIMMGPSQTFTVGIFIDHFIADLQVSRANISLIYGLATLAASLLLPLTGRLIDRFGSKRMMLAISLGLGLACFGMAGVHGLVTIFLGLLALRFFGFGSLQLVSNNVIAQWFVRRRGLVMGISGLSLAIGLVIFPGLSQSLISWYEWRGAYIALGLLVWLVMLPTTWFLVKDKPEQYGLEPDGPLRDKDLLGLPPVSEENWTLAEARHTGAFWIFAAALSAMTMLLAGLIFHHISLFEVQGLSRDTAISAFQVIALFSIISNLVMGRLLDKFSARLLLAVTMLLLAATMVMVQLMTSPLLAYLYAAIQGLTSGCFRVIDSVVWAKYYGRLHLGSIKGATMIGVIGGSAFGPYPLGLSLDLFGSYSPALMTLLLIPLSIAVLAFFINRPQKQPAN